MTGDQFGVLIPVSYRNQATRTLREVFVWKLTLLFEQIIF
jgi:hypothetical protein